jgi:hypothetical protein
MKLEAVRGIETHSNVRAKERCSCSQASVYFSPALAYWEVGGKRVCIQPLGEMGGTTTTCSWKDRQQAEQSREGEEKAVEARATKS